MNPARNGPAAKVSEVDCADCPAAARCWGDPPPRSGGIASTKRVVLDTGTALFRQGDAFDGLYVVASGCLKVRETMRDGSERIVAIRTPGEIVGLEGWAEGRHPHDAIAASGAKVCRLKMPARGGAVSPDLLERVLAKAAAQLAVASRPWTGRPAVERVGEFVADLAERMEEPGIAVGGGRLPLTRAEIGSYLHLAEETVVRALAKLSRSARRSASGQTGLC